MKVILNTKETKLIFLIANLLFLSTISFAAEKYKIKIRIEGIQDSVCYLANYYGDKIYLADTARVDHKGEFIFEGDEKLPGGIYIVAGQSSNQYFEFILNDNQKFSIHSALPDLLQNIEFKNSIENELFYIYIHESVKNRKEIESLNKLKKNLTKGNDSIQKINKKISELNSQITTLTDSIINSNPSTFTAVLLKAMKEPNDIYREQLKMGQDTVYAYEYFKNHYWDDFDIADDRLLRTPIYHKRVEWFFSKVIFQHADTINLEADKFIAKAKPNLETYKYAIWFLTYKFETSKVMGFDEIFVHMVDNYYAIGEAYWADSSVVKSLTKRADELRSILIGSKAPELILMDTNGQFRSLHYTIAPYTIVMFYEWHCGHCKKEIGEMKKWLAKDTLGIKVFAVCTDTNLVKWKEFVVKQEMNWVNVNATRSVTADYHTLYDIRSTPSLFLLNEDKEIIAKRILTEQMEPFLRNYHRNKQRKEKN